MDELRQDLRFALRQLVRRPGITAVLVLTVGLAVGACTAVFSVVDAVLLRPLPYPDQDQLAVVWSQFPSMNLMEFPASAPEYLDYRDQNRSFQSLAAFASRERTLTGEEGPERVQAVFATWQLFPALGVEALAGRVFGEEEDVADGPPVVVVSQRLWERRWGGDPALIGRDVQINGKPYTVLGVLPRDVRFPDESTDLWLPLGLDPANPGGRASHYLSMVGRLRPGVDVEGANAELQGLMARWAAENPQQHQWRTASAGAQSGHPAFVRSLTEQMVGNVRRSLLVLMGAVGVVLLIACANVANLLLARGEGRQREVSVRTALGAGRRRIVRQLVTESLVTALAGGALGLGLGWAGVVWLRRLAPGGLPRVDEIGLHPSVLLFCLGVTLVAGLIFGLAPALQAGRLDVQASLREEGRGTVGKGRARARNLLVISETAMAVVLLVAAGLLIQSFFHLRAVDPGFHAEGVLAAQVDLPAATYPEDADAVGFYRDLLPRLAAIPGVTAAAAVRTAPLAGSLPPNDIEIENLPPRGDDAPPLNADIQVVTPGYFDVMGIPVLQGRAFARSDDDQAPVVAVIDRTLAERFFPGKNPLGEHIRQPGNDFAYAEIVGVVGDVHQEGLDVAPRAMLYFAQAQSPRTWYAVTAMTLTLRTAVDPMSVVPAVRREVAAMDPNLPVYAVRTLEQDLSTSTATQRFSMLLQLVFAAVALTLAAVGLYGVIAYGVAQRTREIGIRMALGAGRGDVVRMVVGQGMGMVAVAVVVGLGVALLAGRVMASLLYGVEPDDPLTFGAVTMVLVLVAFLACLLPARRATGIQPRSALEG